MKGEQNEKCGAFGPEARARQNRWAFINKGCHVAPSLGSFLTFHLLAVPEIPVPSTAFLDASDRQAILSGVEAIRAELERRLGEGRIIVGEHGDSGNEHESSSACVSDAHIHIMCLPSHVAAQTIHAKYLAAGGLPSKVGNDHEFSRWRGSSYQMLSVKSGKYMFWPHRSAFCRQFIRLAAAEAVGTPEIFNWRTHPFPERISPHARALKLIVKEMGLSEEAA